MKSQSIGIISALGLIILFVIGYQWFKEDNPCLDQISYAEVGLNRNANMDSILTAPTTAEIGIELTNWKNFDLTSDSILIAAEYQLFGRQTFILSTFKNDTVHYGAVMLPGKFDESEKYHAIIWANGLNQFSPSVSLTHRREIKELSQSLTDYFIIIPSFRGQSLEVTGHYFCSDGFFGDAFDGATDDALRLYHASRQTYPQISNSASIYGVSRGGTVALLAGIRHPEIQITISQAGPTDFYR